MAGEAAADARIVCHHVGGRAFGVPLNVPPGFLGDIRNVIYEADRGCFDEMMKEVAADRDRFKNQTFLPYCLGMSERKQVLHITKNPFFSSLLQPNPYYANYTCELQYGFWVGEDPIPKIDIYDVSYGADMKVVQEMEVDVVSLDHLAATGKITDDLLPDFLSMDTQGSEWEILKGSDTTLSRRVVAISTEVEFIKQYVGQPMVSDLLNLIDEKGFHFAAFTHLQDISPLQLPIGFRGKGFIGFGDALFLRRIETIAEMGLDETGRHLAAMKLAFISMVFGHVEYAFAAIAYAKSQRIGDAERDAFRAHPYYTFLEQADGILRSSAPNAYVPPIVKNEQRSEMPEAAAARSYSLRRWWFRRLRRALEQRKRIRELARSEPLTALALAIHYGTIYLKRYGIALGRGASLAGSPIRATAFEAFLFENKFKALAEQIQERRLISERFLRLNGTLHE